ncbi:hypothetical protein C2G38_2138086 [Gigaspora rosea]|uniref:Uncharacterized protein n=1 Tax=Gigaspora rosea TaxID=44941 RepID=A0A397VYG8_9GLOM|nr:hypothetical protein C2G38_2138086 [Gigaspora rosea]
MSNIIITWIVKRQEIIFAMSTKNPEESIVKIEEDEEVKELYLATSPFGDFVIEFGQMDLITSKNKLRWSVAVSDKLYIDKPSKSTARLLAISCISKDDMTYNYRTYRQYRTYKEDPDNISGFTIVFFINQDNLIEPKLTIPVNNHGGQVKLFSEYKVKERSDKNSKNTDKKNTNEDYQI